MLLYVVIPSYMFLLKISLYSVVWIWKCSEAVLNAGSQAVILCLGRGVAVFIKECSWLWQPGDTGTLWLVLWTGSSRTAEEWEGIFVLLIGLFQLWFSNFWFVSSQKLGGSVCCGWFCSCCWYLHFVLLHLDTLFLPLFYFYDAFSANQAWFNCSSLFVSLLFKILNSFLFLCCDGPDRAIDPALHNN